MTESGLCTCCYTPHKNGKKNSLKGRTHAGWRKMLVLNPGEKAHDQKIMGFFMGLVLQMWSQVWLQFNMAESGLCTCCYTPHKNGKKNSLKGRTHAGWRKMLVLNAGEKSP